MLSALRVPSSNHAAHNHVHFNDYANYILEPLDANPQNIRKGTKTTFCIIDTTNVNTQLLASCVGPGLQRLRDPSLWQQTGNVGGLGRYIRKPPRGAVHFHWRPPTGTL